VIVACCFFFRAEDGIRDGHVTGVQTCALPILVNWSGHPETLGGENTEITADYPHWLCQYVENHLGGTAIFFNGSIGKVSTLGNQVALLDRDTGQIAEDHTWRKAELVGTTVGQLVERVLKS